MKITSILLAGIASLSLMGCDVLMMPEGTPPPPPDQPPPPPLEGDFEEFPALPEEAVPPAGDALETSQVYTDLAAINAVACTSVGTPVPTQTIAQIANASAPQSAINDATSSNVVQPSVVGAVGGALSLSAIRADFPGIVKLEPRKNISESSYSSGHCGATRISNNWFVTAAHCLDEQYDVTVLKVGHEKLDGPVVREVEADWAACHAAYGGQEGGLANDIALVHVTDETADSLVDIPIATLLASEDSLTPLTTPQAKMAGWGLTSPGGSLSTTLLGTYVDVKSVGPAIIKVGSIEGKGPCVGDSGGPLFVDSEQAQPVLWGVLSGVEKGENAACSGDYLARYTNLQGYTNWLNNVMMACSSNPALCQKPGNAS
ncbi:S1 family peptidase [Hirschia litorea]|uniref:S1 family peptidase n=1 Tax=Hirschia litorea TaxID=1199156 RepID=A0ABW2IJT7_9PROT